MKRGAILFLLLLAFQTVTRAAKLSGIITDEKGINLPFVIVYVNGTSTGTTANVDGYYSLELENGTYEIMFRQIGFKLMSKKVTIEGRDLQLNTSLEKESLHLKEININASGEDPAYAIIRAAQAKRKFYLDQVTTYKTSAYVKSTQRLRSHPKKILGQDVEIGATIDSVTGIFYLSESVSDLYFKEPDKFKEVMISSKVSGSPRTYSFNQSTDVLISLYESLVDIVGLSPRGLVSPIASNSIFYYKFRHEGTFSENGVLINKISVIPKRRHDPVFTGTIYIAEDSWRIYGTDLFVTREQQIEILDTFHIKQNYIQVKDDVWMPFSCQLNYVFDFLGFKGGGLVLGVFSDYNLSPKVNKTFFNGEILSVDENANKKDSSYWKDTRPVPLTNEETEDYKKKDSIRLVHESKSYLDSIDRKSNKFTFGSLLTDYTWSNTYKNTSVTVSMPLLNTNFNTVEGWNTSLSVTYTKRRASKDLRNISIKPQLRYGFSNRHFNGNITINSYYNALKHSELNIVVGTDVVQFNAKKPISEIVNSVYSLWAEKNFMKVYEKQFLNIWHRSDIARGLSYKAEVEYAMRQPLQNSTTYTFLTNGDRTYTPNNPLFPFTDNFYFPENDALLFSAGLSYRPGLRYISRPDVRFNVGSDWPAIKVNYRKGLKLAGSKVDFDMVQFSVDDEFSLGLLGRLKFLFNYGDFLSKKSLYFSDLKHFSGNKTWYSGFRINDFKYLDYYTYSTNSSFLELHAEHNFGGFLLNKLPLLRKLKLNEIASMHFLHTNLIDNYVEVGAGLEKLGFIRAEVFTSFKNGEKGTVGFLIGFVSQLGN